MQMNKKGLEATAGFVIFFLIAIIGLILFVLFYNRIFGASDSGIISLLPKLRMGG